MACARGWARVDVSAIKDRGTGYEPTIKPGEPTGLQMALPRIAKEHAST